MIPLLLGGLALLLLIGGLQAFSRASVTTIKRLLAWIAALAGISLTGLLLLTGKGPVAIFALGMVLPLLREWWIGRQHVPGRRGSARGGAAAGPMSEREAWEVLGLAPGATEADIRAAHRRLMRAAHPDGGGSEWVAVRVNQARDILLGRSTKGRQ